MRINEAAYAISSVTDLPGPGLQHTTAFTQGINNFFLSLITVEKSSILSILSWKAEIINFGKTCIV